MFIIVKTKNMCFYFKKFVKILKKVWWFKKKSIILYSSFDNKATLAQLVEQLICNQPVGGSSPSSGSKKKNYPKRIVFCF